MLLRRGFADSSDSPRLPTTNPLLPRFHTHVPPPPLPARRVKSGRSCKGGRRGGRLGQQVPPAWIAEARLASDTRRSVVHMMKGFGLVMMSAPPNLTALHAVCL